MSTIPNCPQCNSEYAYEDRNMFVCPECAHEWSEADIAAEAEANLIKDMNGNVLNDGDDIIVMKDLKVGGSSSSVKKGTKVKNIRVLLEPVAGHDIDCKIDGFGAMHLKSEFVRKA